MNDIPFISVCGSSTSVGSRNPHVFRYTPAPRPWLLNPQTEMKRIYAPFLSICGVLKFVILISLLLISTLFAKTRVVEFREIDQSGAHAITQAAGLQMEILNKAQLHAFLLVTLGAVEKEEGLSEEKPIFATPYSLPESSILPFNESKALLAYIQVIRYYIDNARTILKFTKTQQPKILVRIARGHPSFALFDLIQKCLTDLYGESYKIYVDHQNAVYRGVYITNKNVYLHYRASTDVFPKFMENFDIVITIGGAYTLSDSLVPGTLLVPHKTLPIRMNDRIINLKLLSSISNDLVKRLPKVLAYTKRMEGISSYINKHAQSPNTLKKDQKAQNLDMSDFQSPLILTTDDKIVQNEGDGLFRIIEK